MKFVRKLLQQFRDSPNYIRDRANLLSGFTIGTTALLLNFAVMILVGPWIVSPDDPDFLTMTENIGLGQLLAFVLLGGAAVFATILIPLRLLTVFWGPRVGRYFDQIVLSGISPLRLVIGKALSQNLFLVLILFLLLPYFVLSLSIGGVDLGYFLAHLVLLWLYCMVLALLTIWLSLYFNELLAMIMVVASATGMIGLGCMPTQIQPFVLTPAPALLQPVYAATPSLDAYAHEHFLPLFAASVAAMSAMIGICLLGIYLGPLYGIIRENSTFGEVVRDGDSKKKRWFRFRQHIQRPSEIAFLYENRVNAFSRNEGLIRWGIGFVLLVIASSTCAIYFSLYLWRNSPMGAYAVHAPLLVTHTIGVLIASLLFSHGKNTTLVRIPVLGGWLARVSRLDSIAFFGFVLFSNLLAIGVAFATELYVAQPADQTIFSTRLYRTSGPMVDLYPLLFEGSVIISCAGLVFYGLHRYVCSFAWLKSVAFVGVYAVYFGFCCVLPVFLVTLYIEVDEFRQIPAFADSIPLLTQASPLINLIFMSGELPPHFDKGSISSIPFYVFHATLLVLLVLGIRRRERLLARQYRATLEPTTKTAVAPSAKPAETPQLSEVTP